MNAKEQIEQELNRLIKEVEELMGLLTEPKSRMDFSLHYQSWYTPALRIVSALAPDRLAEFRGYYEIDPKRKTFDYATFTLQDYIKRVGPGTDHLSRSPTWKTETAAENRFIAQVAILVSLRSRIGGVLANIEASLLADMQDAELATAEKLRPVSARAAGAIAGVVLEGHLQRVAANHGVKIAKRDPTIGDLNDPLKNACVYDVTVWRKLQYCADVRNLCSHKKDRDPTNDEVKELLVNVNWAVKNIS